jgi:hypothetical protein
MYEIVILPQNDGDRWKEFFVMDVKVRIRGGGNDDGGGVHVNVLTLKLV